MAFGMGASGSTVKKVDIRNMCITRNSEADPGFLERGFICFKVWGFALLVLSHFS